MDSFIKFVKSGPYSIVILVALVFFCGSFFLYVMTFNGGLSASQDVWGQFGDFMGGTLNPVLGFLTVIILVSTLRMQREELKDARKAIKYNNKLIKNQLKSMRQQSVESTIFKLVDNISSDSVVVRCKDLELRVFLALYAIKDVPISSSEAGEVFSKLTGGLSLGEFRYVVVEKLVILAELIKGSSREQLYCKLVQTSVGAVLVSAAIQHAKDTGHSLYSPFLGLGHLLRGVSLEYIYNEDVARDFFVGEKFNRFLSSRESFDAKRDRMVSEVMDILKREGLGNSVGDG